MNKPAILLALLTLMPLAQGEIKTTPVVETSSPRLYVLDGQVEAVNRATVSAQTSGRVTGLFFDVDDYVEKGKLIVNLDDSEANAQLSNAKARLSAAIAARTDAVKNYQRSKDLYERKLAAQSELDSAKAALDSAIANQEAQQALVDQAQTQLGYTTVLAPYSGLVTQRHVQIGESVQPGQALLSGISLEALRVRVDVPQSMIPLVRAHQQASIQLPQDMGWAEPKSITIFPYAEAGSNSFQVRLELGDSVTGLYPGMLVKAAFVVGESQQLTIPYDSVVFRSEVTGVYVQSAQGLLSLRMVRLGNRLGQGGVAVLSGLQAGELVAVDPAEATAELIKQRSQQ